MKPERARAIEQLLMRMAQSGQLRGKVSEEQLIDVLDQVEAMEKGGSGPGGAGGSKSAGKITVSFHPFLSCDRTHRFAHVVGTVHSQERVRF